MEFVIKVAIFFAMCWLLSLWIKQAKKNVNSINKFLGGGNAEEGKRRAVRGGVSLLARLLKK